MKKFIILTAFVFSIANAYATTTPMTISSPWARTSLKQNTNGAVFMNIKNETPEDDKLIKANANVSKKVELHTHIKEGDIMRMRAVENIDIPANGETALEPGGLHVMLIDLNEDLVEGQQIPLNLTFEKAGEVQVMAEVRGLNGNKPTCHCAHDKQTG